MSTFSLTKSRLGQRGVTPASRSTTRTGSKSNTRSTGKPAPRSSATKNAKRKTGNRRMTPGQSVPRLGRGPKRLLLWLTGVAFMALLALGLFAGYRTLTSHPYFSLKEITVTGLKRLDEQALLEAAGLTPGVNLLGLNLAKAEARLAAEPWVASVILRRDLPGSLSLAVTEKEPAYWVLSGETMAYADEQGRAIASVGQKDFASLPQARIEPGAERFRDLLPRVAELLRTQELGFGPEAVAWVRLSAAGAVELMVDGHGLFLSLPAENFETGLARVKAVFHDLRARGELARAQSVTASPDRVWVRLAEQ